LLQEDGKILVTGSTSVNFVEKVFVARITSGGMPDNSYGNAGLAMVAGQSSYWGHGSALLPSGNLLLGSTFTFLLGQLTSTGLPDSTFASGGFVASSSELLSGANAVLPESDGKFIVVGGGSSGPALGRYLADGTLDASFGSAGIATTSAVVNWVAAAMRPDGKTVTVGSGSGGTFAIGRYQTDLIGP
jgi:uncharacterized delta-60 repeat protein